jgi:glycosyltransferase involved in cell wall biosynthesis
VADRKATSYSKIHARFALIRGTTRQLGNSLLTASSQRRSGEKGINLVASRHRDFGQGTYAGILRRVSSSAGYRISDLYFDDNIDFTGSSKKLNDATIAVVSPGQLPFAQLMYPRAFMKQSFRTAVIFWDVDKIPARMQLGFKFLDEIWLPSKAGAESFSSQFDLPVRLFRTPVEQLEGGSQGLVRDILGIKDEFFVAYQFDFGSSAMRKNPWAAVRSYKQAFPRENDGAILLLKCSRAVETSSEWLELQSMCESRRDIFLVNDQWSHEMIASLYLDIDCYLSTHRSEGYGLTIAQALAANKYVIATDYGATKDFMPPEFSGRIPFTLVKVGSNPVYPADANWAEPSTEAAAELLREAFSQPERTRSAGIKAGEWVRAEFSLERAVQNLDSLLNR